LKHEEHEGHEEENHKKGGAGAGHLSRWSGKERLNNDFFPVFSFVFFVFFVFQSFECFNPHPATHTGGATPDWLESV
jgi:hypothetical protein